MLTGFRRRLVAFYSYRTGMAPGGMIGIVTAAMCDRMAIIPGGEQAWPLQEG